MRSDAVSNDCHNKRVGVFVLGRFPWHTKGILDRTHLRFFTLKSAEQLLRRSGWVIMGRDVTSIPVGLVFPFLLRRPLNHMLSVLHRITRMWKGRFAYQSIFYCVNPNRSPLP